MPQFKRRPSNPEMVEAIQLHEPLASNLGVVAESWIVVHADETEEVLSDADFTAKYEPA